MNELIVRKAQELSFAVLKVAAYIRRFELRQRIEKLSFNLLENISYQNPELSLSSIDALRNFVMLGKNLYEIETRNAVILDRELSALHAQVRHFAGVGKSLDVESLFSIELPVKKSPPAPKLAEDGSGEIAIDEGGNEEYGNKSGNDFTANYRQEKIMAMIATSPDRQLQLKDFIAAFPELSERTIRYDLKKLADSGRIARQGSGGPSNYYTLKQ